MSWDISFTASETPPPKLSDMGDDWQSMPLGDPASVRATLSNFVSDIDWSDPDWGILQREAFSIEFNIGAEDPCIGFTLHVRGGEGAVSIINAIAKHDGWYGVDTAQGEWLHHIEDASEGLERFNEYRDRVVDDRPGGLLGRLKRILSG